MIIFGIHGVTTTREKGRFFCPQCGPDRPFRRRKVRRFFTLYFIPLIPLDRIGEYLECGECKGRFDPAAPEVPPVALKVTDEDARHLALRKVMVAMAVAEGGFDAARSAEVRRIYEEKSGRPMFDGDVRLESSDMQSAGVSVKTVIGGVLAGMDEHDREAVFEAAWRVAMADGEMHAPEESLLDQVADALGFSVAHRLGLLGLLRSEGRLPPRKTPSH
jgi:tellurite resistance protein